MKNIIIIILLILLGISASFLLQGTTEKSIEIQDDLKIQKNDNTQKLVSLYNQMLPNLPVHDFYCIPNKKSYCTLSGCEDVEANVFILLGMNQIGDSLMMARCDDKPCDIYDVNNLQSGTFTTFETKEPHGILFRTSDLDQSFIEVVTLGTESFVSNGYCYPA